MNAMLMLIELPEIACVRCRVLCAVDIILRNWKKEEGRGMGMQDDILTLELATADADE